MRQRKNISLLWNTQMERKTPSNLRFTTTWVGIHQKKLHDKARYEFSAAIRLDPKNVKSLETFELSAE